MTGLSIPPERRWLLTRAAAVVVLAVIGLVAAPGQASANVGSWSPTGSMTVSHGNAPAAKLGDGRVLVISGPDGNDGVTPATDLYDPATGQWNQTGPVNQPRQLRDPVTLADGRVMIAGGTDAHATVDYASAEIYDPATGAWTYTGSLNTSRRNPAVLRLADGRVMAAAGAHGPPDGNRYLSSVEIWDQATGQWSFTGALQVRREAPDAVLLHDHRVLLFGGFNCCDVFITDTETYDPATGVWSAAGPLPIGRIGAASVVLGDGRVLVVGGGTNAGPDNDAVLFDPTTNQWTTTAPPPFDGSGSSAVLLPDGRALIAGSGQSEIFDPATQTWTADASTASAHADAQMITLNDGRILLAGGYGPTATTTAELYTITPTGISISGTVYVDADGNGTRDPGEAGYPGATVTLYSGPGGGHIDTQTATTTGTNGDYTFIFTGPLTDEHWLVLSPPTGYLGSSQGIIGVPPLTGGHVQDFGITTAPSLPTLFSDDFTGADGTALSAHDSNWLTYQSMPVIQDDTLYDPGPAGADPIGLPAFLASDQCMSMDLRFPSPDDTHALIWLHIRQQSSSLQGHGYGSDLAGVSGSESDTITVYRDGVYFGRDVSPPREVFPAGWHNVKLCMIGDQLRSYIDNTLANSAVDSAYPTGYVSFGLPAGMAVDNFKLQGIAVPPVNSVGTAAKATSTNSSIAITVAGPVAAGQTLTVAVATGTFAGPVGCTDTRGNGYTVVADKNNGAGRLFVCDTTLTTGLSAGDTVTATYPGFSGQSVASLNAVSALFTSGTIDRTTVNAGNNPTPTSDAVSTTHAYELLFGVISHNSTPTLTPGAGFTVTGAVSGGSGSGRRTLTPEYQIVTTAGPYAATATLSSAQQWRAAIITYDY